jgi:hypothetical protein
LRCFTCLHMLDCLHACLTSQTCSSAAAAAAGCTRPAALPRLRRGRPSRTRPTPSGTPLLSTPPPSPAAPTCCPPP